MNYGFIYCLGNAAMPGIFKVGMTERAPLQRSEELSNSTSSPLPFQLLCFGQVMDPREVESEVHTILSDRRVNYSREFFRGPFNSIADHIQEYSIGFAMTPQGYEQMEKDRLQGLFISAPDEKRAEALYAAARFSGIHIFKKGNDLFFRGTPNCNGWIYGAMTSLRDELLQVAPEQDSPADSSSAEDAQEFSEKEEELDW
ncbi:hypothetical protein IPC737_19845 [Pseudomonas aeruginosa]|uniref:GIY-YIG nuclease family protein n=1 Tax=Pseudomonas aeruginosa TaxID=287 RepID=UPI000FEDB05D|nr:GIY-YIG nuclease family protein [Pseudomonas aeruginosa]RPW72444.1 hypothetical protein IPC737_19845 [Pseudomonas aeruginosa]VFT04281.1 T5orf172 domain [Pseudomonas aeruginosa]